MKIFQTKKEILMASPIGQSIVFMLHHQQPLVTALVPMNEYQLVYPDDAGGSFTMKMDYKEVLNLYEASKLMKEAGELHYFDEKSVDFIM